MPLRVSKITSQQQRLTPTTHRASVILTANVFWSSDPPPQSLVPFPFSNIASLKNNSKQMVPPQNLLH